MCNCNAWTGETLNHINFPLIAARRENGESDQALEGNFVDEREKAKANRNACEKCAAYLFIWISIAIWFYFAKLSELTHIGEPDMFATVSCTLLDGKEIECLVHVQQNEPESVEECGTNNSHFCGT